MDTDDHYTGICRLCLSSDNKNMVSLYDKSSGNGLSCYGTSVLTFANINMYPNDNLPTKMCLKCVHLLKQAIKFKFTCERTSAQFLRIASHDLERDLKEKVLEYTMFVKFFPNGCSSNVKNSNILNYTKRKMTRQDERAENSKCASYNDAEVHSDGDDDEKISDHFDEQISSNNSLFTQANSLEIDTETPEMMIEDNNVEAKNITRKCLQISKVNDDKKLLVNGNKDDESKHLNFDDESGDQGEDDFFGDNLDLDGMHTLEILEKLFDKTNCDPDETSFRVNNSKTMRSNRKIIKKRKIKASNNKINAKREITTKSYKCDICNKVLANRKTFENHMQRHNGYKFICEQCGRGYATRSELHFHSVAKHGTGNFVQCDQCHYKFSRKCDLVEHVRVHTGERPFACDQCGLTFRRRAVWTRHQLYHREKTLQCPECPRRFFVRSALSAHTNNVHRRRYVYACPRCGVTYAKPATVRRHLARRHLVPRHAQGRIIRIIKNNEDSALPEQ